MVLETGFRPVQETPPGRLLLRGVRILLECILVIQVVLPAPGRLYSVRYRNRLILWSSGLSGTMTLSDGLHDHDLHTYSWVGFQGQRCTEIFGTFKKPVLLSRFKCIFFISPYSPNLSTMSSSPASSWTLVMNNIHPSTATKYIKYSNIKNGSGFRFWSRFQTHSCSWQLGLESESDFVVWKVLLQNLNQYPNPAV